MIPTKEQVLVRFEVRRPADHFGFEVGEYLEYLDFNQAKEYLKEGVTAEEWANVQRPIDRDSIIAQILEYMEFAWDKANGCRGISSSRSVAHCVAWTWMAGDTELSRRIDEEYEYYGKPQLVAVCEHYGWDWKKWDNDRWTNEEGEKGIAADIALGRNHATSGGAT